MQLTVGGGFGSDLDARVRRPFGSRCISSDAERSHTMRAKNKTENTVMERRRMQCSRDREGGGGGGQRRTSATVHSGDVNGSNLGTARWLAAGWLVRRSVTLRLAPTWPGGTEVHSLTVVAARRLRGERCSAQVSNNLLIPRPTTARTWSVFYAERCTGGKAGRPRGRGRWGTALHYEIDTARPINAGIY